MIVGGLVSIPVGLIIRRSERRKEARFLERMRADGRTISSATLAEHMHAGKGTLIREWVRMFKGSRLWWTEDDLYRESPYPAVDLMTLWKDGSHCEFLEWCWSRYTSLTTGKALLVECPQPKQASLGFVDDIGDLRLIDIPMDRQ